MIGTIVNTGTILAGSVLGSIVKKGIKEEYQGALFNAMGLAATGLGINAVVWGILFGGIAYFLVGEKTCKHGLDKDVLEKCF